MRNVCFLGNSGHRMFTPGQPGHSVWRLIFGRLMARARCKLEQRRSRTLPGLLALLTNQPPGEIVHACRRHMRQSAEIDIARRLAARALNLQPREAAVDGLIDCRRWIDGAAVAPHAFVPALTGEVVSFADQRLALAPLFRRPLSEDACHRPRLRKLFLEGFAVAAGQRGRVMFRSHSAHLARRRYAHGCGRIRARRAASRNRPRCWGEVQASSTAYRGSG